MTAGTTRAGFVAVIGAPNAGKSTLVNALVGQKVAIVSPKAQTTRARLMGIAIQEQTQILLVDTPGIFEPRRRLDRAMAKRSEPANAADSGAAGRFLSRLQTAIRADDRPTIAGMIAYPLRVNFNDGPKTYKNSPSIERDFERIFTPQVKKAILDQGADELFTNYQGSMIGSGEVWFDQSCSNSSCSKRGAIRIKAINP